MRSCVFALACCTLAAASTESLSSHLEEAQTENATADARRVQAAARSSGKQFRHKELFPIDLADFLCFFVAAASMIVAAGGGIGGGGILVPLYILFLQFRPKHAVALSNFTILGGALANTMLNVPRKDDNGRSLIDWDIIVMMEPSTIGGTVIGSFASKYLSDFVLMVSLATVLSILSFRTLDKGIQMFRRESEEENDQQAQPIAQDEREEDGADTSEDEIGEDEVRESRNLMGNDAPLRTVGQGTPWNKVMLLIGCFAGSIALTILKGGSGRGSIIGVECGSASFWLLSWACIPWVLGFGMMFRQMLIRENYVKEQDGHEFDSSDIRWDSTTTIKYPLLCTLAGVFAGLFGVGGGIVKGPLMLEMGVNPQVAAATAAAMILFTSSAACVSFEVFGLLEPTYGPACFILGFACTLIGHYIINVWMKAARRQSPPVLSIGLVMVISTLLVIVEIMGKLTVQEFADLIVPASLCGSD